MASSHHARQHRIGGLFMYHLFITFHMPGTLLGPREIDDLDKLGKSLDRSLDRSLL